MEIGVDITARRRGGPRVCADCRPRRLRGGASGRCRPALETLEFLGDTMPTDSATLMREDVRTPRRAAQRTLLFDVSG